MGKSCVVRDPSKLKQGLRLREIQDITIPSDKGTLVVVESDRPFVDKRNGRMAIMVRVDPEREDCGELRMDYLADHGIGSQDGLRRYVTAD
jgi:hypothetical protein